MARLLQSPAVAFAAAVRPVASGEAAKGEMAETAIQEVFGRQASRLVRIGADLRDLRQRPAADRFGRGRSMPMAGKPQARIFRAVRALRIRPMTPVAFHCRKRERRLPRPGREILLPLQTAADALGSRPGHFRVVDRAVEPPRPAKLRVTRNTLQQAAVEAGIGDHQQHDARSFRHRGASPKNRERHRRDAKTQRKQKFKPLCVSASLR